VFSFLLSGCNLMKLKTKTCTHSMNHPVKCFAIVTAMAVAIGLAGCDPGQPNSNGDDLQITGFAKALTQDEFNELTPEQQYQVANKLYGTFFRGISAEDFFDLSSGTTTLVPKSSTFLTDTREKLKASLSNNDLLAVNGVIEGFDEEGNPNEEDAKYEFDDDDDADENERAMQIPLARIKEYPISRDFYVQWMAYFLSNTIMYSPAVEMETADTLDAQNMYSFLTSQLKDEQSISAMVRSNLPSLKRWRVSRSSENHALEAYELYLGLFETEEDSVKGGIACKDFFLTDEDSGYILSNNGIENTEPQLILETYFVTTCTDFYDAIAGHPLIIPRATEVLVNYIYSGRSREDRVAIIDSITGSGVETYEDIFTAMLFSKEYLLNTERPRSFEENLMPLLDTLKWHPEAEPNDRVGRRIFENMVTDSNDSNRLYLGNKGWDNMTLKIGRLPDVPMDALSFANYHKGIREHLLTNEQSYDGSEEGFPGLIYKGDGDDADENLRDVIAQMSLTDYVHFLFLNAMQRKASATELDALVAVFDDLNLLELDTNGTPFVRPSTSNNRHNNIAEITFDYISRLPEFYYFKAVN